MRIAPFPRHAHFATPIRRAPVRRRILYAPPRPLPRKAALRRGVPLRTPPTIPHPDPLANIVQQQAIKQSGVPIAAVQAAQAVDALINRIDNPLVTAAVAPVFLGTAALSAVEDVGAAVGDFFGGIFGGSHTLTPDDYVRMGKFAPGTEVVDVARIRAPAASTFGTRTAFVRNF